MIKIIRNTKQEVQTYFNKLTEKDYTSRTRIKKRFNITKRKWEWYFEYTPAYEIEELSKSTINKLSEWADKITFKK